VRERERERERERLGRCLFGSMRNTRSSRSRPRPSMSSRLFWPSSSMKHVHRIHTRTRQLAAREEHTKIHKLQKEHQPLHTHALQLDHSRLFLHRRVQQHPCKHSTPRDQHAAMRRHCPLAIHHHLHIRPPRLVHRLLQLDLAEAGASGHALIFLGGRLVQGRQPPLGPQRLMSLCMTSTKLVKLHASWPRQRQMQEKIMEEPCSTRPVCRLKAHGQAGHPHLD
jgi:hypothetical protein